MMKVRLLKQMDGILGAMAAAVFPPVPLRPFPFLRRLLLIRPGGIGDAGLLIPSIVALKKRFPEAAISVLAERRNAAVFSLCTAVDHLLLYDRPADLLTAIRGGYDLVIDTEQWHRLSALVARLTRAPISVGFATNNRSRLFAHRIPYSHADYEMESFFRLLEPLGIPKPDRVDPPFLVVPERAARRVAELLPPFCCKPYAVIFPGASIAERRWGAERYRGVAERLSLLGVPVVVVGGKEDAADGESIVAGCGGVNLAGRTSLPETAAVLARAALLVSGDSGVLHLAVGLGIPTVSLFGPGIQEKWGPRGPRHAVLNRRLSCSPCTRFGTTSPCPIGARCMAEISVDDVAAAAAALLKLP